jgi:dihydropteroate synthase
MRRLNNAKVAGIPRWLQVINLGNGFAKDVERNVSLIRNVDTLWRLCHNFPFLFGQSQKRFIGKITGKINPKDRDYGMIAAINSVR